MTIPNERAKAMLLARKLLKDVATCEQAPEHLRADARHVLRHYPLAHDVVWLAKVAPSELEIDKSNPFTLQALKDAGNDDPF